MAAAKKFTDEEMTTLRRYIAMGLNDYEISERMGRSQSAIQRKRQRILNPDATSQPTQPHRQQRSMAPTTKRRCLKCRHMFKSEWEGNRLCEGCKKSNNHVAHTHVGVGA